MKIINTINNEVICEITTNHSMTLDEAIALMGEYHNENAENGTEDVEINGAWYYYEDLDIAG